MKRIYVNEDWCLNCHLCEYYCAFAGTGEADMSRALKGVPIYPKVRIEEGENSSFAVSCRHCLDPLCVKGCITGALSVVDGVVLLDKERCICCYTCVSSCPFGAMSTAGDETVQKCELCTQTKDKTPACVAGCLNAAIVFEERG